MSRENETLPEFWATAGKMSSKGSVTLATQETIDFSIRPP